tara:strand:+ start:2306 stop:3289 length:984 start_codon:yes stop_codon:yes gene_type:complete
MTRCSVGRATQKYTSGGGGGADLSSILEAQGDIIYADFDIEANNLTIGNTTGHVLTVVAPGVLGWQAITLTGGQVGNLQQVTVNGPTTDQTTGFLNTVTSLTASGNVLVTGNVTAEKYFGDGTTLSGIALSSELTSNALRISNLEASNINIWSNLVDNVTRLSNVEVYMTSNVLRIQDIEDNKIVSGSSGITGFTTGDIIYASGANTLTKLGIGSASQILTVSGSTPAWVTAPVSSLWQESSGNLYYTAGNVGVGVGAETPTATLQVGSNVYMHDIGNDKLQVTGNVYVSRNLKVVDAIETFKITTTQLFVREVEVTAERPTKSVTI